MGILDELRRETGNKPRTSRARKDPAASPLPVHVAKVVPLLETMHSFLEHFCKECNEIEPDALASYRIADTARLTDLQQRHYKVEVTDTRRCCFRLTFLGIGQDPLTIAVSSRAARQSLEEHLDSHELRYQFHNLSTRRSLFTVEPRIPVTIRFEPHPDIPAVRMTTRNFDRLGESYSSIDAASIDDTLLDELARRIVRRPNRFEELIEGGASEVLPVRLQEEIATRRQARKGSDEPRRRKRKARVDKGQSPRTGSPPSPKQTAPDTSTGDSGARGDSQNGRETAEKKSRHPRYAWMVTGDVNAGSSSATIGKIGPPGVGGRFTLRDILTGGHRFRMRNQEGRVIYTGYITGEFNGFEPLADYGAARGCLVVEYETSDGWAAPKARKPQG